MQWATLQTGISYQITLNVLLLHHSKKSHSNGLDLKWPSKYTWWKSTNGGKVQLVSRLLQNVAASHRVQTRLEKCLCPHRRIWTRLCAKHFAIWTVIFFLEIKALWLVKNCARQTWCTKWPFPYSTWSILCDLFDMCQLHELLEVGELFPGEMLLSYDLKILLRHCKYWTC